MSEVGEKNDGETSSRVRIHDPSASGLGRELAIPRVMREPIGATNYPTLTRSNYGDWVLLMRVILQARGLWRAVEGGEDLKDDVGYRNDRMALEAILRAVPPEMLSTLAVKATAKEAWDTIKTLRMGSERVRNAKAQTLRSEFEEMKCKPGESIDELSMRLTGLVNKLSILGDEIKEKHVMEKFLRIIPKRYSQLAMSVESLLDLNTLSMEELTGRFKAAEERFEMDIVDEGTGKLLLSEEEWLARMRRREQDPSSGNSGNKFTRSKSRGKVLTERGKDGTRDGGNKRTAMSGGRDVKNDKCRYCGIKGHWARDCRKKQRDEAANLTQVEDEEPSLLMARVVSPTADNVDSKYGGGSVFLNEEHAQVHLSKENGLKDAVWYLDTGASNHMTGNRAAFTELDDDVTGSVRFGDESVVEIKGRGTVLFTAIGGRHKVLTNVYFIPKLRSNIVSLGQLDEVGCEVLIKGGVMRVHNRQQQLLAKVTRTANRLYVISLNITRPVCMSATTSDEAWMWHGRFGHLNFDSLRKMARTGMVRGLPHINHVDQLCDACLVGKQRRAPFPLVSNYRAKDRLDLVHGDLCGPITPASHGGKKYFLLLVDDKSRYMWSVLLASKDEAPAAIKKFQAAVEVEIGRKLRALRTDRGGEFTSVEFGEYCAERGLHRQLTAPYSPQQNGVVERRNQSVMSMARCLLKARKMPGAFWGEAVSTAVFILNCSPTQSVHGMTPYEAWHGEKPAVHFFRIFGCVAHVKVTRPNLKKLDDRSFPTVFIGYEHGSKAYRVFDPTKKRVHVTRDAVFDEAKGWAWDDTNGDPESFTVEYFLPKIVVNSGNATPQHEEAASPATSEPATPHTTIPEPATPTLVRTPPTPRHDAVEFVSPPIGVTPTDKIGNDEAPRRHRTLKNVYATTGEHVIDIEELLLAAGEEPLTFEEAEPHACWRKAMLDELGSIVDNRTWTLTNLPAGKKPIGLKWVFKLKKNNAGEVIKHKARLVAKGYVQRAGIDFDEVFAPVARLDSVRVMLAVAAHAGWEVHHLDVKSAFLNGDLEEEVYVAQPPGFVRDGHEHKVLRLHKALYGLRQAPRAWNAKLDDTLLSLGFHKNESEHAVYTRGTDDERLLLGVYVDDLIITGAHMKIIDQFKEEMKAKFQMSDLGKLSYYLGIEVHQGADEVTLRQSTYATKILEKAGMTDCNPVHVPLEPRLKLSKVSSNPPVDTTLYRSIVGSLRYLVHTRPDIAFAVGYVSRFMESPTTEHWSAVKHILRYLAGTLNYGCRYVKGTAGAKLIGYSDADMAGDVDDRKSTTGVVFILGGSPVSWQSQKQKVVALSSCEAEYIAATTAACQGVWLAQLLGALFGKETGAATLLVDNKSAIQLCKNPVFHDRSKHIETRYHFIRQCVEGGKIAVEYIHTDEQLADLLTKPLGRVKFQGLRTKLGVVNIQNN